MNVYQMNKSIKNFGTQSCESSIKLPEGLFDFGHFRGGLKRDRAYSKNRMTRI